MDCLFIKHNDDELFTREPYCDCEFPNSIQIITSRGNKIHQLCKCKCFDNDGHNREWTWDKDSADTETFIEDNKITFHPEYSQGTQIIRGNKRLEPKMIHYWEIQICSCLTGTDMMFGIGTDKVNLNKHQYEFTSALGEDSQSWSYSYRGFKHHNAVLEKYGKKVTQGCIISVYLDLLRGHLEFYLNRKTLGIAYINIPIDDNTKLYPMICSTSSRSAVRLVNSTSVPESLEFRAMKIVSKKPNYLQELIKMPGLKRLMEIYWFLIPSSRYSYRSKKNELPIDDEVVLSKRAKKIRLKGDDHDITDINDIYSNVKIPIKDSEDDISVEDYRYYLL